MAKARNDMLANIADSMGARPAIHGESAPAPAAARPSLERQSEGRRRLDSGALIRVDRIVPDPAQPRQEWDQAELERLADSLKSRGQLQPIRVRWDDAASRYVVVVGERRWRAAQLAGLEMLACVVVTGAPSAEDLLEDQLVENCVRLELKPVEQARAFKTLLDRRGMTQRELADRLAIGQASIARALALLGLPDQVQTAVDAGAIAPDVAYQISRVDDPQAQAELAELVVAEGLTRGDVTKAVQRARPKAKGRGAKPKPARKPVERVFRTVAGPRVTVEFRKGLDASTILAALDDARRVVQAELDQAEGRDAA